MAKKDLDEAKKNKQDEFYTQLADIENELVHYRHHFKGKVIYCNCDDPKISKFFHYFAYNFEFLGLKRLITTCYKNQNPDLFSQHKDKKAVWLEYAGDKKPIPDPKKIIVNQLNSDGDFRNKECMKFLHQADIVCTNPPFPLFREYMAQLMDYKKKFLIIGNPNAIAYKEIFPLIKENKIWLGIKSMAKDMLFDVPEHVANQLIKTKKEGSGYKVVDGVIKGRTLAIWFTNLEHHKRNEDIDLVDEYNETDYPKYDNYNAINVNKLVEIPKDYDGVMGVPLSFLSQYNPDQFEILGLARGWDRSPKVEALRIGGQRKDARLKNGKELYIRILIKKPEKK
ncbi:MAG: adenine-specific methyltransferase EcoRI family protein [Alphaproteobacteria bacterium]